MIERIKWYLRQLLPLTYVSKYAEREGEVWIPRLTIWRMWFGRCYAVRSYRLAREEL